MKDLKQFIIKEDAMPSIIKKINDIINDGEDLDVVIYDLLDGISNNGEDDLIVSNIESWLEQLKK